MNKGTFADKAFLRCVAIEQSVNTIEEGRTVCGANTRCADTACMADSQINTLRRCRMACQKIEAGIGCARYGTETGIGFHRLQEAR